MLTLTLKMYRLYCEEIAQGFRSEDSCLLGQAKKKMIENLYFLMNCVHLCFLAIAVSSYTFVGEYRASKLLYT